jgi:ubiquinone biosynthesis protein COQ4
MARFVSKFEVRKALTAARALVANPGDLPKVFTIIEALSGGTLARIARRMAKAESGRRLLRDKPDVVDRLEDRAALARLPEGSLGRAYLAFVESEQISAAGIRAAAVEGSSQNRELPAPLDYVHARMRDTHDLWHAVTGYQADLLGEIGLLAFTFAQTRNPGIALLLGVGLWKLSSLPGAWSLIAGGYRRGRKAAYLPAVEWESLLEQPVSEVRARLSVEAPPSYQPLRGPAPGQPAAVAPA